MKFCTRCIACSVQHQQPNIYEPSWWSTYKNSPTEHDLIIQWANYVRDVIPCHLSMLSQPCPHWCARLEQLFQHPLEHDGLNVLHLWWHIVHCTRAFHIHKIKNTTPNVWNYTPSKHHERNSFTMCQASTVGSTVSPVSVVQAPFWIESSIIPPNYICIILLRIFRLGTKAFAYRDVCWMTSECLSVEADGCMCPHKREWNVAWNLALVETYKSNNQTIRHIQLHIWRNFCYLLVPLIAVVLLKKVACSVLRSALANSNRENNGWCNELAAFRDRYTCRAYLMQKYATNSSTNSFPWSERLPHLSAEQTSRRLLPKSSVKAVRAKEATWLGTTSSMVKSEVWETKWYASVESKFGSCLHASSLFGGCSCDRVNYECGACVFGKWCRASLQAFRSGTLSGLRYPYLSSCPYDAAALQAVRPILFSIRQTFSRSPCVVG